MVVLLMLSGLGEGIGIASLLPLLNLALEGTQAGAEPSSLTRAVESAIGLVGLRPTPATLLGIIVVSIFLKSLFLWLAMRQVGFTVAAVTKELRLELMQALLAARWSYFAKAPLGEFANAVSGEATRASTAYRDACVALGAVLQVFVYLAVAMTIAWHVSLGAIVVGTGFLFLLRKLVRLSRSAGEDQTRLTKSLTGRLVDALQGIKPVKAMAREDRFWPLFEREAEGLNQAHRTQVVASETLRLFQEPLVTLTLAIGLYVALSLTDIPFSSVLVLAFVFFRLLKHMNSLQTSYQTMTVGESAFWSIRRVVEEARAQRETESGGTAPPPRIQDQLRFEDVSFVYEGADATPVVSNMSLSIPAGGFVALSGPSGTGKTTVVDLIAGLHRPVSGEVWVDGVPMAELDLKRWRQSIGYVPQDTLLFNDTILRNVTLGDETVTREQAKKALEAAGAWDFVAARPEGLDARVGESGGRLSGGQRQRIAIARALVSDPTLLILDEVTTALDPETEAGICRTLLDLRGRVTIVAISHQKALQDAADALYTMESGSLQPMDVVEGGVEGEASAWK